MYAYGRPPDRLYTHQIGIGNTGEFVHLYPPVKTSIKKQTAPPKRGSGSDHSLFRTEMLIIALLVAIAASFWCYVTGRTSWSAWQVPLEYGLNGADADAQAIFSHVKAASEGEFYPFLIKNISRLGAPYYANWSDFPIIEEWQFFLPGVLARFIGLYAAVNFAVLLAQVLACVSFYFTARMLKCKWQWAFAGGIAFGFAQFALARSVHHLMVTNYWYVPFCLLIAGWVANDELGEMRARKYLFTLLASFLIGMQNPYYTNMFLQFVLFGALYQYFRKGWRPIQQAGGIVGAAAFGFFLMNFDTLCYRLVHGPNARAVVREYRWLELSALKLTDLFVPPQDHPLFGAIGRAYYGLAGKEFDPAVTKMVAFPGEVPPSCYLGILGIACFVWLAVVSARRLMVVEGGDSERSLPAEAWQVLWILIYAAVGGVNCLVGVFGVTLFRSSTRYCIFILPILLLFAAKRLSNKRIDAPTGCFLAAICALLALWDQTPPVTSDASILRMAQMVASDRMFSHEIESRLPQAAMVFQLPIMEFPESPAPGVSPSEHFRPYLNSAHLRFSFGAIKGRPWLRWQQELSKAEFPEVIRKIEAYGFAAVYVNRNGFQDRGEGILNAFKQLGYKDLIESPAGDLFCVLIHPDANPILPAGVVK